MTTTLEVPTSVPINTITWTCTHNAFNSQAELPHGGAHGGGGSNQNISIIDQLNAGVRALMIDVHADYGAPRVRHVGGMHDPDMPYEDLCDLLIKLEAWFIANPKEVVILLMEVAGDVNPQWIKDTFAGAGPVRRPASTPYNLAPRLYAHPGGDSWPSIERLIALNQRLVVFRETDGDKGGLIDPSTGQAVAGMDWYHDMWAHWLETPYSNTPAYDAAKVEKVYWDGLQASTYVLSPPARGQRTTAAFFNLNHFVDSASLAAGSAGMAAGMNVQEYLKARALIAWKMQARRPTISIDFFDPRATGSAIDTANDLNRRLTLSGVLRTPSGDLFTNAVRWDGVANLEFSDHLGSKYLDWTIAAVTHGPPTSRHGAYCFPADGANAEATLTPKCAGYLFEPSSVTWKELSSMVQHFTVTVDSTQLVSGGKYNLGCMSEHQQVHLAAASGSYARTSTANAKQHHLDRVDGPGSVMSGDEVYIKSTEHDLASYYLRNGTDLWYESGSNPTIDHRWRIVKLGSGDRYVRVGDTVALRRPDDANSYLSAKGIEDYVNVTDDSVPEWTFS